LFAIPLFGTAICVAALRKIAESDGTLAGRWAAAVGLALCVTSGAAALSHAQFTRYLYTEQSKRLGLQWVDLVRSGQWEEAFKLTVASVRPAAPPEPGAPPTTGESPFDKFVNSPLVRKLAAAGADSEVRFAGTLSFERRPYRQCAVRQQFNVVSRAPTQTAQGSNAPVNVALTLSRSRLPGESQLQWLISAYDDADVPTDSTPNL
jgi:hypothetical protein